VVLNKVEKRILTSASEYCWANPRKLSKKYAMRGSWGLTNFAGLVVEFMMT
jgi:hypothetical protein